MKRMIDNKDYEDLKKDVKDVEEHTSAFVINQVVYDEESEKVEGFVIKDVDNSITYNVELGGGGKQLYQHNLNWGIDSNGLKTNLHGLFIINDSADPFTFSTLLQWLVSHGYVQSSATDFTHRYSAGAYGTRAYGDGSYQFLGLTKTYGNNFITLILRNTSYDGVITSLDTDGFTEDIIPL